MGDRKAQVVVLGCPFQTDKTKSDPKLVGPKIKIKTRHKVRISLLAPSQFLIGTMSSSGLSMCRIEFPLHRCNTFCLFIVTYTN